MKFLVTAMRILGSTTSVVAHATWQEMWVNGEDQAGACVRLPSTNNPVNDVSSTDIRCNVGGTVGVSGLCTVPADGNVTVEIHQQPGDRSCANEAIGGNHYGPVIIYMSKVSDATADTGEGLWFKVAEEGYNVTTQWWGTKLYRSIRSCTGQLLLRAEVIALHVPSSVGGAQFYMSCFQINVTGSGTETSTGVSFPGAYSATDPGILINIYQTITNNTIPGPATMFTG